MYSNLSILWHCLFWGLEWKLTFSVLWPCWVDQTNLGNNSIAQGPHFTDEETDTGLNSELPNVTQLSDNRVELERWLFMASYSFPFPKSFLFWHLYLNSWNMIIHPVLLSRLFFHYIRLFEQKIYHIIFYYLMLGYRHCLSCCTGTCIIAPDSGQPSHGRKPSRDPF